MEKNKLRITIGSKFSFSMKNRGKIFSAAVLMVLATTLFIACNKYMAPSGKKTDLTGTWKLDSYKYGNTDTFLPASAIHPRIKIITEDTFLWVSYDTITGRVFQSAGGSYTLEKDNYIESIIYGLGMDRYLRSKSVYKVMSDDDMLFMTGELSDSLHIEEVWRKIK